MFCMAETNAVPTEKPWREMSDEELALSFVDFNLKTIKSKMSSSESSLNFYENYKSPPTASRPSYIEAGSMDASDWDVAEMEDEQFENDRDGIIENLKDEIEDLRDEFHNWDEDKEIIAKGDEDAMQMIKAHSALERTRREKLEESSKPKQTK